jgi:hypothetical protein
MSHPVPATLYRIAAAAGCGSAVVLLINAAKRAEVIPTSAFTQLVAPSRRSWRWPSSPGSTSRSAAVPAPSASSRSC